MVENPITDFISTKNQGRLAQEQLKKLLTFKTDNIF